MWYTCTYYDVKLEQKVYDFTKYPAKFGIFTLKRKLNF